MSAIRKIRLPLPEDRPTPKICVIGPGCSAFFMKLFKRESISAAGISSPLHYELEDGTLYELMTSMSEHGYEPLLQHGVKGAAAVIVTCIGADRETQARVSQLCHAVADVTSTAPLFIACMPRSGDMDSVARAFEDEIAANLGRVLTLAGFYVVRTTVDAVRIISEIHKQLKPFSEATAAVSSSSAEPSPSSTSSGSPPRSARSSPRTPPASPSDSPRCALQ